jgi:hypothetical protein
MECLAAEESLALSLRQRQAGRIQGETESQRNMEKSFVDNLQMDRR